ncbi:replicative DNA helicase [Hymenobacter metallicola]|uniref:Replicative DNA helicase n=1 Tax=Hymenobacter metallicola TaxID=2563114 RepID=A0A4Z0QIX1_9BACT|nr:replicative DNA helicase [Hymenobacter metallicola]TGE29714.1 replicative DNA helicase [Hymenobacter metallicola]
MHAAAHLSPNSIKIEMSVLGIILAEARTLHTVLSILSTADVFYVEKHQLIYTAILHLHQQKEAVDLLTVVQHLRGKGTLKKAGDTHYIASLSQNLGNVANLESYCRILQQQYARRVVIKAGHLLEQHGYDEGQDPLEVVAQAQMQLTRLQQGLDTRGAVSAAALLPSVLDSIRKAVGQKGMTGVPTGLTELNDATGGWQPTDFVVIGARPGMGKTAALLYHAREAAIVNNIPTAIFSMEMPAAQLVLRLLATEVDGYSNNDLRRGKFAGGVEEVDHIASKAQRLGGAHNLFIDDTPALNIHQLSAKAARLVAEHGVGLILIDYLQLMSGTNKGRGGNRETDIAEISRGCKALAKELNVPVIALSQLSRSVEQRGGEKRPQLSDLRESGTIEQDADMVIFLWRGEYYNIEEYADGTPTKDTILYDIAKHRGGALGEMVFGCRIQRGLFSDLNGSPAPAGERPFYDKESKQTVQLGKLPASRFEEEVDLPF